MAEWGLLLNGVYLGCDGIPGCPAADDPLGLLSDPPEGLGLPSVRTEDVTYPQRDGVRQFRDWYEPRIITATEITVCLDECYDCGVREIEGAGFGEGPFGEGPFGGVGYTRGSREKVREITQAWARQCDDVELVVFTDCHGTDPRAEPGEGSPLVGPFGVIGRPRVAEKVWDGPSKCAVMTLRFDGTDHRMYILDSCGTPGSGVKCVTLTPTIESDCRDYNRCYDTDGRRCYDVNSGETGNEAVAVNIGDICACTTITLNGRLTNPMLENVSTGEKIGYSGIIGENAAPVVINGEDGTATQGGASRTHLLTGSPEFCLPEGASTLRLTSFGPGDSGSVDVCWRNAVVSG